MLGLAIFIGVAITALGAVIASAVSQNASAQAAAAAQSAAANNTTNNKDHKPEESKTLIGIKSPALFPTVLSPSPYVVTTVFDSTTFPDKCRLIVKNETGSFTAINDFSIRGLPIYRYAGNNGYKWEYFNHADIEENGEKEFKVSNNYITNAAQCEDVGDFYRKELEPHDMYTLTLNGSHPYFKIGDRYELNIDYQLPTEEFPTELISVDVEIRGVMISRACDNIGQTVLSCRVPYGEWNNTTNVKARWISSGLPFDRLNRTTEITIAASDYAGQADIYCDGINDDVEIQDAIDKLSALGGGTVKLTNGSFYISTVLTIKENIFIQGMGESTKLVPSSNSIFTLILTDSGGERSISNLAIYGDYANIVYLLSSDSSIIIDINPANSKTLTLKNIHIYGYRIESIAGNINVYFINGINTISGCIISDIHHEGNPADYIRIRGFANCKNISLSKVTNITSIGDKLSVFGMSTSSNITSCEVSYINVNNTSENITGISASSNISACSINNNSGYAYSGYETCSKITVASSTDNTGVLYEYGFNGCKSVQQCKSDDSTPYHLSYADSGTSNACADTSSGGFNS